MSAYTQVRVNGVVVDMFDDTKNHKFFPMRATLQFFRTSPYANADLEALTRLHEAGVKTLPLVKSEAEAAGIVWEEWASPGASRRTGIGNRHRVD